MLRLLFILLFTSTNMYAQSVYSFNVKDLNGKEISLKEYEGKVILIVNTASECGFTSQYKELEDLYQMYQDKGFVILAFPSNDFGGQEPLNGKEIQSFCSNNYHITFPVFDKVKVKGDEADPLFVFLSDKSKNGAVNIAPKWNFQKYLVDRKGRVVDYYLSPTSPVSDKIRKEIEKLLADQ